MHEIGGIALALHEWVAHEILVRLGELQTAVLPVRLYTICGNYLR